METLVFVGIAIAFGAAALGILFLNIYQRTAITAALREQEQGLVALIRHECAVNRRELNEGLLGTRGELTQALAQVSSSLAESLQLYQHNQKDQLAAFASQLGTQTIVLERNFHQVREMVENRLQAMQNDNGAQLERMREVVDEKLHKTLEDRLSQSFSTVAERLERVQRGLGEMQSLAQGVGDLKRVLTNVKTKGIVGEMQLESILQQIMAPQQYSQNIITKRDSRHHVEFAIRLPGRDEDGQGEVWVPVDAKFPTEDYHRLVLASEEGHTELAGKIRKQLYQSIKVFAKDIRDKYIDPPHTTDFAIMFLPTEGLYAEVLRDTELFITLQRDYKITVTGPTTFSAFVYSLQMGFRSLAIERQSSEVWKVLGGVKSEFEKFALILAKTRKKLAEANNVIESAETRTRAMGRALKQVESIPAEEATELFSVT